MKVRTLIACAATAAALPFASGAWASANATTLGGPQGTGSYGVVDPLDPNHDGRLPVEERSSASVGAGVDRTAPYGAATYDRNADGVISSSERAAVDRRDDDRRDSYSGPSWATNPPAPAI